MKTTTYQHLLTIFSIIVIVSCVCAVKQASAQVEPAATAIAEIKPLKIGDEVPDELWNHNFPVVSAGNDQTQMLKLGDYKDKLIILDFWATWCGSCIVGFKQVNSVKDQIGEDVKIIPVTGESINKVLEFFNKKNQLLDETIYNDSVLNSYFLHRSIPHYVWIYNGKVHAITDLHEVNYKNISGVLSFSKDIERLKKDILQFDRDDLYSKTDVFNDAMKFGSTLTRYVKGVGGNAGSYIDKKRGWKRVYYTNADIISLYRSCVQPQFHNNYVIESKDKKRFFPHGRQIDWLEQNQYCFEMVVPIKMDEIARKRLMHQQLDQYLELNTRTEKKPMECWVISGKAGIKKSAKALHGEKFTLSQVIQNHNMMIDENGPRKIIVSELEEPVLTLFTSSESVDFVALSEKLKSLGFKVSNEIRSLDVFVISDACQKY